MSELEVEIVIDEVDQFLEKIFPMYPRSDPPELNESAIEEAKQVFQDIFEMDPPSDPSELSESEVELVIEEPKPIVEQAITVKSVLLSILSFPFIVVHELGHYRAGRKIGLELESLKLWGKDAHVEFKTFPKNKDAPSIYEGAWAAEKRVGVFSALLFPNGPTLRSTRIE